MSAPEPGVSGTMNRIGLDGKSCAVAHRGRASIADRAAAAMFAIFLFT